MKHRGELNRNARKFIKGKFYWSIYPPYNSVTIFSKQGNEIMKRVMSYSDIPF